VRLYIRLIETAPGHDDILRIVAPNPGPMTLEGTNTYVVGSDPAWVIDPGPAIAGHIEAVRAAGEARGGIAGVLLTHSHADHSVGVDMLGAPLLHGQISEGDETAAPAETAPPTSAVLDGWGTTTSGQDSPGRGGRIGPFTVLASPGHASDHVCFTRETDRASFCGDLILGQGSSIVPPSAMGGSLADYMESLARLAALEPSLLCPGHGPWITDPAAKIAEYVAHRNERERKLVAALEAGERDPHRLLDAAWDDVPLPMRGAAAIAMAAHLEKLEDEGRLPDGAGTG
jgi:glyoxylase-like metal-dependent hydrolase (beta-lactamase superfamily II)